MECKHFSSRRKVGLAGEAKIIQVSSFSLGTPFGGRCTTKKRQKPLYKKWQNVYFRCMQGRKNYQEKLFTCFKLSDRVPADNIYRQILQVVDFQFLYKMTSSYYGKEGQASIDPVVFFKLMLIGYLENMPSDRKIIRAASMRLDMLFFIGYDIDDQLPWHSTLSRTRKLYGEGVFQSLFKQVLKKCIDKGMVSGRRQAIDSVLVKANASMESLSSKEILSEIGSYAKELEDNEEENEQVAIIKMDPPARQSNNRTHYSPTDPEAKIATKPGKPVELYYQGQVSVDTASHTITCIGAFPADKKDSQCLKDVVEQTQENLKEGHLELEEILADTNYSSTESLEALKELNVIGYIPNAGGYKSQREGFTYDKDNDRYICAQGKYLTFKGLRMHRSESKRYLSSSKDCKGCPIKMACIGNGKNKMLTQTLSKPLFEEMKKRVNSRKGRILKTIRHSTAEPVIGTLIHYTGLRKLYTKGLQAANKCMIMAAIAYNLKKLLKFKPKQPVNSWAMAKKGGLSERVILFLLYQYRLIIRTQ